MGTPVQQSSSSVFATSSSSSVFATPLTNESKQTAAANLGLGRISPIPMGVLSPPITPKTPLTDITNKSRESDQKATHHRPSIQVEISKFKRTKCPSCSSPAKQYHWTHAECQRCTHSFCPRCLDKSHDSSCRSKSPTETDSTQVDIGTEQCKKRMKRL